LKDIHARRSRGGDKVGIGFIDFSLASQAFSLGEGLDFQGMAGLSLRCLFGSGEDTPARPLVHRQDEPTKLSLGKVASQQSPEGVKKSEPICAIPVLLSDV
jgi:hypothetical protein